MRALISEQPRSDEVIVLGSSSSCHLPIHRPCSTDACGISSQRNGAFSWSGTATYRFGFQGQEKDDEVHGSVGTSYAFEYRMHDPRVGRFLSIDPLAAKYPYWSPYAFSGNQVIATRELEGLEPDKNFNSDVPSKKNLGLLGTATGITNGRSGTASSAFASRSTASPQEGLLNPFVYSGVLTEAATSTTGAAAAEGTVATVATNIALRVGGTVAAFVTPQSTGDLISPHEQEQFVRAIIQAEEDQQPVTLFRGVANNTPINQLQYDQALHGIATPRGLLGDNAHMSMEDHTFGYTETSLFTSWSTQESVAEGFARRGQIGGVVLTKQFPRSVLRQMSALGVSEFKEEHEVLIMGVQIGAQVRLLR